MTQERRRKARSTTWRAYYGSMNIAYERYRQYIPTCTTIHVGSRRFSDTWWRVESGSRDNLEIPRSLAGKTCFSSAVGRPSVTSDRRPSVLSTQVLYSTMVPAKGDREPRERERKKGREWPQEEKKEIQGNLRVFAKKVASPTYVVLYWLLTYLLTR